MANTSKKVLITGGAKGIGASCAKAFAAAGYNVIINYNHSQDAAEKLAKELGCTAIKADISSRSQAEEMFAAAGNVDILVNNAGISISGLFTDMTLDQWNRIFNVNVDGVFNCCQLAIPHMVHEKYGRIINISSIWGITGASCECAYSATKSAVIGLTKALAKELGPSGITVNSIAPGVIATDMLNGLTDEDLDVLRDETPIGRLGSPEDIANAALFLASERAGFITGQVLSPNGGFVI